MGPQFESRITPVQANSIPCHPSPANFVVMALLFLTKTFLAKLAALAPH
jgi:hypothetical protein